MVVDEIVVMVMVVGWVVKENLVEGSMEEWLERKCRERDYKEQINSSMITSCSSKMVKYLAPFWHTLTDLTTNI